MSFFQTVREIIIVNMYSGLQEKELLWIGHKLKIYLGWTNKEKVTRMFKSRVKSHNTKI